MRYTILAILLAAASSPAITALPILGYSSSTGFLFGGYMVAQLDTQPQGSSLSVDAYYGTAGVIKFQPAFVRVFPSGILSTTLECRKIIGKDWFGWGNNTDPDSTAEMDIEMYHLLAEYTLPVTSNLFATMGLDARHSSVFNRQESGLWDMMPGQVFDPTLTAGLAMSVTAVFPTTLNGDFLIESSGFFQEGDVSYSGLSGRTRLQVRPWSGGEIAVGTRVHKHYNVEQTPIPYTSGIGAHNDFRGFSDYRFTGSFWGVAQFEVRQRVLTLKDQQDNPALTFELAAFTEAGRAAESFSDLLDQEIHTDIGTGIRIGAGQEAKMRIDAAWGDEGMVLSTGFQSAF